MEPVCTTNVVARENGTFWNMLLWEISGPGKQTWNPRRGQKIWMLTAWCTPKNFTHNDKERETKFLIKFFSKPCPNLAFFGPTKDPTKAFFRWDFLSSLGFGRFAPRWCGNFFTWNLFVPLMLLPGKTNRFEICCCGKFLGLANKHGTHEGAAKK